MRNWPLFRLRVTTPRLELRVPTLDDLDALADRALEGVHDPDFMPFISTWTDAPRDDLALNVIQYHLSVLASWRPEDWRCNFVVVHDGTVIGTQGLGARDLAVTRQVGTGSWLGKSFQGRGFGTEMRAAALHFAFEGLGAEWATSGAFSENAASQAVSRKLGYRPDGIEVHAVRGEQVIECRLRLRRETFESPVPVEIHGLDDCRALFGVRPVTTRHDPPRSSVGG